MANKPFNSRIQLKHDTEANWLKATGFNPLAGELIIYDVDANHAYPRFKIGDGSTNVNSLPFTSAEAAQRAIDNTISASSTSTNLPTSAAVASFVEGKGYTSNAGTITEIKMNGASKGTSGVVDLGTVVTDVSGKADKTATVSNVAYDSTNKKITKTINGATTDVVTADTLKSAMALNNVENKSSTTIRSEISSANITSALGFTPLDSALKGASNGVAELGADGKVPSSQLPSYVDDVLEYANKAGFPSTGETGKIYVDIANNLTYRWSGSDYIEISPSIALGTTSSTAFRGDYGDAAYKHAVTNKGAAFASGLYKITTNSEGHVTAATAVVKSDITELGIPASDTNTTYTLTQDATDGHKLTFTGSDGSSKVITIPDKDTTYENKAAVSGGTDLSLVTTGDKYAWDNKFDGPLIITTTNASASDALTYGSAETLTEGRIVFVFLKSKMAGTAAATLKFGSNAAIPIYKTADTTLVAPYVAGTLLALVYHDSKLYLFNGTLAA